MDTNLLSLDEEYVYATECNFATLEKLALTKKTSKSEVRRQSSICTRMLRVCYTLPHEVTIHSRHSNRVARLLTAARESETFVVATAPTFAAVVDLEVERLRST